MATLKEEQVTRPLFPIVDEVDSILHERSAHKPLSISGPPVVTSVSNKRCNSSHRCCRFPGSGTAPSASFRRPSLAPQINVPRTVQRGARPRRWRREIGLLLYLLKIRPSPISQKLLTLLEDPENVSAHEPGRTPASRRDQNKVDLYAERIKCFCHR